MLKKILTTIILFTAFAQSVTLTPYSYIGELSPDGNIEILITYDEGEVKTDKDWIGIYKKGTSSEWENVRRWSWVTILRGDLDNNNIGHIFGYNRLVSGEYEARFFKNNSFETDKVLSFTVKRLDSFLTAMEIERPMQEYDIAIVFKGFTLFNAPEKDDWVGLYKVGTSNEWENVINWKWVKDTRHSHYKWLLSNLKEGDYEVRYFLQNSFKMYKKTDIFHIDAKDNNPNQPKIENAIFLGNSLNITFKNLSGNNKDWFAVFAKGKEHISKNIIYWVYNDNALHYGVRKIEPILLKHGEYDIVLFENNSYKVLDIITFRY